jgi:ABC-type transporter MlaC component
MCRNIYGGILLLLTNKKAEVKKIAKNALKLIPNCQMQIVRKLYEPVHLDVNTYVTS